MRLKLSEDPKEWRKAAWFGALGFAVLSSVLRWRRVLSPAPWDLVLVALGLAALMAWIRPRWFRAYYRLTRRVGFFLIEFLGKIVLGVFFFLFLTPLGLVLRALGKDPLRRKRSSPTTSYWIASKESSPLDRLF